MIIYDFLFLIFVLVCFPFYLLAGKLNAGFFSRLGFLPKRLGSGRPIWIHAVSVGEVVSIKGLLSQLRQVYPDKRVVISTVTATGNKIARGLVKEGDFLTYLPLDFSFIVKRVLKKVNPCIFIIAETEIWPNLISCLYQQKIPVITVNGRISDNSYAGYRAVKLFIRPILKKISRFCVQSDTDALRLRDLGVAEQDIQVTGNVKFDINLEAAAGIDFLAYRKKLGLSEDDRLLVCGSTHHGEEELILKGYPKLLTVFPRLKLLIAARHPQRSKEIASLVVKSGFTPVFISNIDGAFSVSQSSPQKNALGAAGPVCVKPVFILDVIGELFNYYSAADIVFMGGSLVKKGGHNILEPASLRKPVIFGPHMFNFREISGIFLKNNAAIMAHSGDELADKIKEILASPLAAEEMVNRAYKLIIINKGATLKNIQVIKQLGRGGLC